MGIPVSELKDRLTDDELEWYLAFSTIEPFGAIHDERRAATAALASLAPHTKKSQGLEDISPYLADCADVGTDTESKEQAQADKLATGFAAIRTMPGWSKVERKE